MCKSLEEEEESLLLGLHGSRPTLSSVIRTCTHAERQRRHRNLIHQKGSDSDTEVDNVDTLGERDAVALLVQGLKGLGQGNGSL